MFNWTKGVLLTYGEDQPGGMSELDTMTCPHCSFVVVVKPGDDIFTCKSCMKKICPVCAGKRELGDPCYPFEKRLEDFEKSVRFGADSRLASLRLGS